MLPTWAKGEMNNFKGLLSRYGGWPPKGKVIVEQKDSVIYRGLHWGDFDFKSRVWEHDFRSIEIRTSLNGETERLSDPCPRCGFVLSDPLAEYGCWPIVEIDDVR